MKKVLKSIAYILTMGTFLASFSAFADDDFDAWKKTFEKEALQAGVKQATLTRYLPKMELLPHVIEQDIKKPEFLQNFWDYTKARLTLEKIAKGKEMMQKYPTWLKRVQKEWPVSALWR